MKRRFGSRDQEWLHPQHFHDEPVYCEAPHRPEDVLYSGSDDEAYSSAAERRIRLETQARRFIEGKPVFLLSASLRGPFDRTSGWVNPWRSKSDAAYRTGTTQRRKRPAPQRAAGQNDSSNPCPPLTPESKAAEQPQVLYTPPLYMDDDAFERVRNWRDRVIAETIGVPTSAAQSVPHTEPTSADSRRATQQTIRRQSDITPRTPNDELARTIPPDTTDLSPRAVKLYEQLVLSSRESRLPSAKRMVTNETASKATHAGKSLPSTTRGAQKYLKAANSTPLGAVLEATLSSAPAKTQASSRTDGSFRYRRRDGRGKASSLGRSKLADPPSAPNDPSTPANSVGPIAPTAELEKSESNESTGVRRSAKASRAMSGAGQPVDEVSPGIKAQQAPEGASQCHPPQSIQDAGGQATDQGHGYKHDVVEAASQIDGPTLVPSWSPSNSDHMSMPSFGHFSVEKHSQDVVSSAFGLPRRLLWPKSRRSALGDDLFASGLESSDTPVSKPQELGLECCHTQSTCPPAQQKECPPQTVENITTVRMPSEQNVQTSGQRNQHVFPEVVVRGAEGAANGAAERETTSEAEDEHLQRTEEPHIPPEAESAPADQVEPEQSGVSQRPEAQSPWVTDDSAAITRRPSTSHSQHRSDFHSSPPNATQSPWTKETDLAPGASGSACLAPSSHVPAAKPSLVAVEQAASQSPWARGDSQLQLPATRLFKPLSSPASSHVLPTGNTITHSESRDDDVSMHDSQLYPHRPSTPETRQSGLPTPDFTFSVKSFKQFMTPSPRPAAKRRRISAITDDHLPSTQALVDAAISNPWAAQPPSTNSTKPKSKSKSKPKQKHKRPAKRVSWADQAGEEEPSTPSSTHPSDQPAQPASSGSRPRRAAASPPPSILSTAELPAADQKFGRHFAAVASRRVGTTTLKAVPGRCAPSAGSRLLPSASQQVCASPAVGAMAEAFLRADAEAAGVLACDGFGDGERDGDGDWQRAGDGQRTGDEDGDGDGDGDNMDGGRSEEEEEEETEEEEPQVDDVSAVLQNLDDFIQSWDLDVELAKARTERERESRAHRDVPGTDAGLSGLLDIGVWD
ncbi:uncharacterized protein THITE_2059059 [Thermothielavioides terrestris NRRL 8126]|uniref:Protamine P1 n=1 Tax=Thermothielavioides terrestris (strain ATCC 38088 / NRRL 8126) TaxID=578455 RepID=G2RGQ0_THETT|nr:uncharacterized protein THITE_2059059 [Thermothielavioides terrestris NRRL 8126]AEO71082.1 hypothetical protein THITE_2059059 [Thermothielavioides terrestris NRRL 8126]